MKNEFDYFKEDGTPIKCMKCECTEFIENYHAYLDNYGPLLEYGVSCAKCGIGVNYWAYGYWEYKPRKESND